MIGPRTTKRFLKFDKMRRSKNVYLVMNSKAEGRQVEVPFFDRGPFYAAEHTAARVRELRQLGNYAFGRLDSPNKSKHRQYADKERETGPGGYRANRMRKGAK